MSQQELLQGVLPDTISLVYGHPDANTLPVAELLAAAQAVLQGQKATIALQYGPLQGCPDLIDSIVERLNRQEGLALSHDNVMITAGSTHALDMIARRSARQGGVVLVEAPTYHDALAVFRDHGLEPVPVPIDEQGMIIEDLAEKLAALHDQGKRPGFIYIIPNFQNPSGITTTLERRQEILRLARKHGFLVVEDDVYRDLAFEGEVPPSFFALADGRGVLRIGSFSKTVAPGLRLGWLMGDPDLIQEFANCGIIQMGGGANPFVSYIMAHYCRSGNLEARLAHLRQVYRWRRDATLAALERYMPPGTTWTRPRGGFFVWVTLPEKVNVTRLQKVAQERGVFFVPGTGFFVDGGGTRNLRLAYSFVPPDQIEQGVSILAQAIRELL